MPRAKFAPVRNSPLSTMVQQRLDLLPQMALDVLGWAKENREDVNFVLESKLLFTQPTEPNWRRGWTVKMTPVSALLVTLGSNTVEPPVTLQDMETPLQFPAETGVKSAALLLIREKNNRYSMIRVSIMTTNGFVSVTVDG